MLFTTKAIREIAAEVERQGDGPEHVTGLTEAIEYAVQARSIFMNPSATPVHREDIIQRIAALVELQSDLMLFRRHPVTFLSGGHACNWQSIYRNMDNLCDAVDDITDEQWIKEFLDIHPFADGNGRTAFVIWNVFFSRGEFAQNEVHTLAPTPNFFG
jgi:hypothetical protein